jgi:GH25 family lysozyme M1 (1,4-beta-N-acetylmuramidase)
MNGILRLCDVSFYQGVIDFMIMRAMGIWGVIIKATQGIGYTDPKFAVNVAGAIAAGLKVGWYWVWEPGQNPEQQAEHAISVAGTVYDIEPACDVELTRGMTSDRTVRLKRCLDRMQVLCGYQPIVYSNAPHINVYYPDAIWLWMYRYWGANYSNTDGPLMPKMLNPKGWYMRQWSSTLKGSWYGVQSASVDGTESNGPLLLPHHGLQPERVVVGEGGRYARASVRDYIAVAKQAARPSQRVRIV